MITLAQIGCGYWGPNLLRNFNSLPNCNLRYLVDTNEERCDFVKKSYPNIKAIDNVDVALNDTEIDGVIIATPAGTHFQLAKSALSRGKHVFVEKPLATSVDEVDELEELANKNKKIVMAGHTFLYNAAVRYVRSLIDSDEIGDIRYIYSQRLNLGRIRSDVDVLWNLAPHDISIIQYWLKDIEPISIERTGMAYVQEGIEDVAFLNIKYPDNIMANVHVSCLDPHKTRKMVVVGSKKMVVYDDVSDNKIMIFDKGIDIKAVLGKNMDFDKTSPLEFDYRTGDILIPKIDFIEPIRQEAEHFLECISTGNEPISGVTHAREVVRILQKAQNK